MLPVLGGGQSEVYRAFFVTSVHAGKHGQLCYEELYHLMRHRGRSESKLAAPAGTEDRLASQDTFQSLWWSTGKKGFDGRKNSRDGGSAAV